MLEGTEKTTAMDTQGNPPLHATSRDLARPRHPASLYETLEDQRVRCNLCAHFCKISAGKLGACRVRCNVGGELFTLVYGRLTSQNIDPIEKKPLYHFYPGSKSYSIATPGCNFRCKWCQNWSISQAVREDFRLAARSVSPANVVANALDSGSSSIAYTYTEPTIFYEFAYDTARLAHEVGISNVFVTNGYMTGEMLEAFHPLLDAANVDLKAFRDSTYRRQMRARLSPVLESMRTMKRLGIWLEVTTLVIPGLNDDPLELRDTAQFIAQELGVETPWHISRFFPAYEMRDRPPTPLRTLHRAYQIGVDAGLRYVYVGNVEKSGDTVCHACQQRLIRRLGYWIVENHVSDHRCPSCGTVVAGVGLDRDHHN